MPFRNPAVPAARRCTWDGEAIRELVKQDLRNCSPACASLGSDPSLTPARVHKPPVHGPNSASRPHLPSWRPRIHAYMQ
jgi:hypothetical protein